MFRSRRNSLVKRLWKQRIDRPEGDEAAACALETAEESDTKAVAQAMLKRLKEAQLDLLVQAVESRGADDTGCVLVPKGDLRLGRRTAAPHVLCCQLWRWADVRHPEELKRLHWCEAANDPVYMCCNPYHWSRLCKPDSPPPPYCRDPQELFRPEDRAPSELVSTEPRGSTYQYGSFLSCPIGTTGPPTSSQLPWCKVAYWELRTRVGRLFPVHNTAVNVFADLPHGDGLCLGTLARTHDTKNECVVRTREKIGTGVTLSKEDNGVWVYNRSDHPIFVNSPTLDLPNTRTLTVRKVPSGFSIRIFDYEKSRYYQSIQDPELLDGPFDPNAARISFAKGWGPKYSRQFITSCPCWLEILLMVAR